jgi:hypothetical protein
LCPPDRRRLIICRYVGRSATADLFPRNCLPNGAKSTNAARSAQLSGFFRRPAHDRADGVTGIGIEWGSNMACRMVLAVRAGALTHGQQGCRK